MKKNLIKIFIAAFLIVTIPLTVYGFNQYNMVKKHVDDMQINIDDESDEDKPVSDAPGETVKAAPEEPLLFLLLGIGDRPNDPGRADAIMVVAVNPEKEEILTFSIPRDTKTEIIGKGTFDKINHSYAYGGTKMTVKTVEHFIDQEIDYLAQINMQGMRDLVDSLGGIEVDNPFYFSQTDEMGKETYYYREGKIQLDGERALHYSRMRKMDPKGDLGRNERQKQVIQAILDKAKSPKTLFSLNNTMQALSDNVKTNISFSTIKDLFKEYQNEWNKYKIKKVELEVEESPDHHVFYYQISDEELENTRQMLKEFLGN